MPRLYIRKNGSRPRIPLDPEKLKKAVKSVLKGKALRTTAKLFGLSPMTLKRYCIKQRENVGEIQFMPNYKRSQIFNDKEEENLVKYIEKAGALNYGTTSRVVRRLAFQFAQINKKKVPKRWTETQEATYDWLYGFMRRHSQLSILLPFAKGPEREIDSNKQNESSFYDSLRNLLEDHNFKPHQIWNVAELEINIIQASSSKKNSLNVKAIAEARSELVTVCVGVNVLGGHLPPYVVFPCKKWQSKLVKNGPPGSDGTANSDGTINSDIFVRFLKHFKKNSQSAKDNPCIIILENTNSHISMESLNYTEDNGIHLLTIPSDAIEKLQPLNKDLLGPLKTFYNATCYDWMTTHPGQVLSINDVAGCLAQAYSCALIPTNIQNSFSVTGISPFNPDIYPEDACSTSHSFNMTPQNKANNVKKSKAINHNSMTTDISRATNANSKAKKKKKTEMQNEALASEMGIAISETSNNELERIKKKKKKEIEVAMEIKEIKPEIVKIEDIEEISTEIENVDILEEVASEWETIAIEITPWHEGKV